MIAQIYKLMVFMKDDQQAFVRYMITNPHLLSLDMPRLVYRDTAALSRNSDVIKDLSEAQLTSDFGLKILANFRVFLSPFTFSFPFLLCKITLNYTDLL